MINARPNLNGNTPEDFRAAAMKIHDAAVLLQEAIQDAQYVIHGRNYQTVDPGGQVRDRHTFKVAHLAAADHLKLANDILAASKEEND